MATGAPCRASAKRAGSSSAEYILRARSTRLCASSTSTLTRHWLASVCAYSMALMSK